jgi:hypothetical protein
MLPTGWTRTTTTCKSPRRSYLASPTRQQQRPEVGRGVELDPHPLRLGRVARTKATRIGAETPVICSATLFPCFKKCVLQRTLHVEEGGGGGEIVALHLHSPRSPPSRDRAVPLKQVGRARSRFNTSGPSAALAGVRISGRRCFVLGPSHLSTTVRLESSSEGTNARRLPW